MPFPLQGPVTHALLALATALTLAACASGPPKPQVDYKQDYSFGQVRKIAFFKHSGQVTGENPVKISDIQRNRADIALQQALEKRGYQFVDDPKQADLLLSWHLATQEKTDVRTYQSPAYYGGYGYGYAPYNRYARYNCWSCMPTQTEVSVQEYTEGTFIVDMIDPDLSQSVWRGVIQSKLKGKPKNEGQQERMNAAADAIFASFPPN
jgi:hypothetical protein